MPDSWQPNSVILHIEGRAYKIIDRLGKGSFSQTWEVIGPKGEPAVAIRAKEEDNPILRRSQESTIQNAATVLKRIHRGRRLNNIMYLVDESTDSKYYFQIVEDARYAGADKPRRRLLSTILASEHLPAMEVVRIIQEVGHVLSDLHRQQVVWNDVKSDNIFWDRNSGLKAVDFGNGRVLDDPTPSPLPFQGSQERDVQQAGEMIQTSLIPNVASIPEWWPEILTLAEEARKWKGNGTNWYDALSAWTQGRINEIEHVTASVRDLIEDVPTAQSFIINTGKCLQNRALLHEHRKRLDVATQKLQSVRELDFNSEAIKNLFKDIEDRSGWLDMIGIAINIWDLYKQPDQSNRLSAILALGKITRRSPAVVNLPEVKHLAALIDALPETCNVVSQWADLSEDSARWLERIQRVMPDLEQATLAQLRLLGGAYESCEKDSSSLKLLYLKKMLRDPAFPKYPLLPDVPELSGLREYEQLFKTLVQDIREQGESSLPDKIELLPPCIAEVHHQLSDPLLMRRNLLNTARHFNTAAVARETADYKETQRSLESAAQKDSDEKRIFVKLGHQAEKIVALLAEIDQAALADLPSKLDTLSHKVQEVVKIDPSIFEPWKKALSTTIPIIWEAWGNIQKLNKQRNPEEAFDLARKDIQPAVNAEWRQGLPLLGNGARTWWTEFEQQQETQIYIKKTIQRSITYLKAGAYSESRNELKLLSIDTRHPIYGKTIDCLQLLLSSLSADDLAEKLPLKAESYLRADPDEIEAGGIMALRFTQKLMAAWQCAKSFNWKDLGTELANLEKEFSDFRSGWLLDLKQITAAWESLQSCHWRHAQTTLAGLKRGWVSSVTGALNKVCAQLDLLGANGYMPIEQEIRKTIKDLSSSIRSSLTVLPDELLAAVRSCKELYDQCRKDSDRYKTTYPPAEFKGTRKKWEDGFHDLIDLGTHSWPEWRETEPAHHWYEQLERILESYERENREAARKNGSSERFIQTRTEIRAYRGQTGYSQDPLYPFYDSLLALDREEIGTAIAKKQWTQASVLIRTYQLTQDPFMALFLKIPDALSQRLSGKYANASSEVLHILEEMNRLDRSQIHLPESLKDIGSRPQEMNRVSHSSSKPYWTKPVSDLVEGLNAMEQCLDQSQKAIRKLVYDPQSDLAGVIALFDRCLQDLNVLEKHNTPDDPNPLLEQWHEQLLAIHKAFEAKDWSKVEEFLDRKNIPGGGMAQFYYDYRLRPWLRLDLARSRSDPKLGTPLYHIHEVSGYEGVGWAVKHARAVGLNQKSGYPTNWPLYETAIHAILQQKRQLCDAVKKCSGKPTSKDFEAWKKMVQAMIEQEKQLWSAAPAGGSLLQRWLHKLKQYESYLAENKPVAILEKWVPETESARSGLSSSVDPKENSLQQWKQELFLEMDPFCSLYRSGNPPSTNGDNSLKWGVWFFFSFIVVMALAVTGLAMSPKLRWQPVPSLYPPSTATARTQTQCEKAASFMHDNWLVTAQIYQSLPSAAEECGLDPHFVRAFITLAEIDAHKGDPKFVSQKLTEFENEARISTKVVPASLRSAAETYKSLVSLPIEATPSQSRPTPVSTSTPTLTPSRAAGCAKYSLPFTGVGWPNDPPQKIYAIKDTGALRLATQPEKSLVEVWWDEIPTWKPYLANNKLNQAEVSLSIPNGYSSTEAQYGLKIQGKDGEDVRFFLYTNILDATKVEGYYIIQGNRVIIEKFPTPKPQAAKTTLRVEQNQGVLNFFIDDKRVDASAFAIQLPEGAPMRVGFWLNTPKGIAFVDIPAGGLLVCMQK